MMRFSYLYRYLLRTLSLSFSLFGMPLLAFAQPRNFSEVVSLLFSILGALVPIIIAITLIVVLWAGAQLVLHADNPNKRSESRSTLIWGILVLFIMVSVWGIINIFRISLLGGIAVG